jgi:hypothetical protein
MALAAEAGGRTAEPEWCRRGAPPRPIRWVLVREPAGKRASQAFFSTDTMLVLEEIISIYARRWQVEVTFSEAGGHLGVETRRQRSDKAINRTPPRSSDSTASSCPGPGICSGAALHRTTPPDTARTPSPSPTPSPPSGAGSLDRRRKRTHTRTAGTCRKSLPTASSAWQMHTALRHNVQSRARSGVTR